MSSVLIVDDEPAVREFLGRWLIAAGHEIREAPDAETAVASATAAAPEVVLCDMHMPGRDGRWLVEQLRNRCPGTAIVLATADAEVPPAVSLKQGIADYLVKPFQREAVVAAVARAAAARAAAVTSRAADDASLEDWLQGKRST